MHTHTHSHSECSFLDILGSHKFLCLSICCSICLECSVLLPCPATAYLTFMFTFTTQLWPQSPLASIADPEAGFRALFGFPVPIPPPSLCVSDWIRTLLLCVSLLRLRDPHLSWTEPASLLLQWSPARPCRGQVRDWTMVAESMDKQMRVPQGLSHTLFPSVCSFKTVQLAARGLKHGDAPTC